MDLAEHPCSRDGEKHAAHDTRRSRKGNMIMKRSTIFLSSTFEDLQVHREYLLEVFKKLDLPWIAMEVFGSRPSNPLIESIKAVKECDIFVIILGTMYGSCPNSDISITESEYNTAIENNL